MQKLISYLSAIALTLWVGGLWATGYLAVPVLFQTQPDRQLAGLLAGEIFHMMAYVGLVCGGILLLGERLYKQDSASKTRLYLIVAMLILGLVIQFGISPVMADLKVQAHPLDVMSSPFADHFKMLHGVSSILYLIESVLGMILVVKAYVLAVPAHSSV